MRNQRKPLAFLLVIPCLLAFGPRGQVIAFQPEEGSSIQRSCSLSSDVSLQEMTLTMNGQEMDSSMFNMEMSSNETTTIVVTDTFESVDDGRATMVTRTFDELSKTAATSVSASMPGFEGFEAELDGESELTGLSVVFEWDGDAEEYDVSFADDSDGDEELLEELAADMDLTGLLPDSEVSEGDTWEADPEILRLILAPSGHTKINMDLSTLDPQFQSQADSPPLSLILGEIDGTVDCELVEVTEEDGANVARIQVSFDVESANDLTEYSQARAEEVELPDGMPMDVEIESVDAELTFSGAGEMLWNLDSGVLHSFELSGERTQIMDSASSVEAMGQSMDMENSMTMGGSMTISLTYSIES